MIRDAFAALQRNYPALLLYIGITTGFYALKLAGETYLLEHYKADTLTGLSQSYLFLSGLVTAALYAVAQAIAFSKLGQDLDRPFWKVDSAKEALIRFFGLWFLLDLINLTLLIFTAVVPVDDGTRATLQVFWLMWAAFYVPLGATIMFYGHLRKEELKETLSTICHQLPSYFIISFFAFCVIVLVLSLSDSDIPLWSKPGLSIVDGYMKCFIFACTWYICRIHRDRQDDQEDDFDF